MAGYTPAREASRGASPAHTWISNPTLQRWDEQACSWSHPVWYLLCSLEQTHTLINMPGFSSHSGSVHLVPQRGDGWVTEWLVLEMGSILRLHAGGRCTNNCMMTGKRSRVRFFLETRVCSSQGGQSGCPMSSVLLVSMKSLVNEQTRNPETSSQLCPHTQVALVVKKKSAGQHRRLERHKFDPWVRKIPWSRAQKPTPVLSPGESHGQRSLVGYSPWGHKESRQVGYDWHTHTTHTHTHTHTHTRDWFMFQTSSDEKHSHKRDTYGLEIQGGSPG